MDGLTQELTRLTQELTRYKIPVGQWGKQFFGFLTSYFDWFFDGMSKGITAVLDEDDPARLRVGMEMELIIASLFEDAEGNEVVGYKFRSVDVYPQDESVS